MSNILGKCMQMCPIEEIKMREKERLLHSLEILAGTEKQKIPLADPNRVIKCYTRSAAGLNLKNERLLRPPNVLEKTVHHLLTTVVDDEKFDFLCKYNFITDRFRAINQDMVIQCLGPEDSIKIYEPIIRFYVFSEYNLCEVEISKFDPVLHRKQFVEYLKLLLICYDNIKDDSILDIVDKLDMLQFNHEDVVHANPKLNNNNFNRSMYESIYILSNLGDTNVLMRYFDVPKKYRTPLLNTSFHISLNCIKGNFVKVCQLIPKLNTLLLCLVQLQLPSIRKHALKIMNVAFHSKNLLYPAENLKNILLYKNITDVKEDCKNLGILTIGSDVRFDKNSFNDSFIIKPKRSIFIDNELSEKKLSTFLLKK